MEHQQLIVSGIQQRKQNIANNITGSFKTPKNCNYSNLILVNTDDQILFLKRANIDEFGPGKWCVPGGKIESFENPKQAAVRETVEETRIPLTVKDIKNISFAKEIKKASCIIYYYILRLTQKFDNDIVLDSNEHQQYVWTSVPEALVELKLLLDVGDHLKAIFDIKD